MEKQGRIYFHATSGSRNHLFMGLRDGVAAQNIVCVCFKISLHIVWFWRSFYSQGSSCYTYLVFEDVRVLI